MTALNQQVLKDIKKSVEGIHSDVGYDIFESISYSKQDLQTITWIEKIQKRFEKKQKNIHDITIV